MLEPLFSVEAFGGCEFLELMCKILRVACEFPGWRVKSWGWRANFMSQGAKSWGRRAKLHCTSKLPRLTSKLYSIVSG